MGLRRTFRAIQLILLPFVLVVAGETLAAPTRIDVPPPVQVARTISAEELLSTTQQLLPAGAFLGPLLDTRYGVIKHDWLARKFVPFYRDALNVLRAAARSANEGGDCDDFGMFLRHMIGLAGMVAGTAQPAAAKVIAFQDRAFSGVGRTRERHAIGLFLTDEGWFVLEPQEPSELVPLSSYPNRNQLQYVTYH